MTFEPLCRASLLTGLAFVGLAGAASAQQVEEAPPPSLPPRPVILPMTPGSELKDQQAPDVKQNKPRIISVPGAGPAPGATSSAFQPERSPRNPTQDYTFCNKTSYALDLAVGIRNGGLFASRGWWTIRAGECKVVIQGPLAQPTYYSFARSSHAHTGPIRTWGGAHTLCTGKIGFQASSDGSATCGPGLEPQGFAKVDTGGKNAWTTTLSEAPGYKSPEQARVAGLQRLLYDLGRFDGPVDGVPGPKFNETLSQARVALTIPPNDGSALYNKLLAEALRVQTTAGLTFCNRTQDIVWSALGVDSGGKKLSQGWWRLQPGQCAKVIKDRLADPFLYAFASVDHTEGAVDQTWGGAYKFCTRDSSFEIDDANDCEGRGFKTTGFLRIDNSALRPGITFEFAPRSESAQQ